MRLRSPLAAHLVPSISPGTVDLDSPSHALCPPRTVTSSALF